MEKGKIRVLEMIDDASLGGGQIHVLLLAKYLDKTKFDVSVACEESGYLVDEVKKLGLPLVSVQMDNRFRPKTLKKVFSLLGGENFDVLHTHGGTAGFWGRIPALISRRPQVRIHSYHGIHYLHTRSARNSFFRFVDKSLLPLTDKVICVCRSDYEKGLVSGVVTVEKGEIILYGIEMERFRPGGGASSLRSQFGAADSSIVFGNVGRLHAQKGQKYLLEAFCEVKKKHPSAHLWIIGWGELKSELERMVSLLGIGDSVRFLGSRTDIPELLSAIDVFVLPSLWEGQPISLLEAMVSSKPIIASSVDGISDILIDGENALLVPPADPGKLASAMARVMTDAGLRQRLADCARRTAADNFSAEKMAEKIGNLYSRLREGKLYG